MLQRVDRAGEAAIDHIGVTRRPSSRAKAANEVIFGNADHLREIDQGDVATNIGADIGEHSRQLLRRQRMWRGRSHRPSSALLRQV
jgi:hypothetical protein